MPSSVDCLAFPLQSTLSLPPGRAPNSVHKISNTFTINRLFDGSAQLHANVSLPGTFKVGYVAPWASWITLSTSFFHHMIGSWAVITKHLHHYLNCPHLRLLHTRSAHVSLWQPIHPPAIQLRKARGRYGSEKGSKGFDDMDSSTEQFHLVLGCQKSWLFFYAKIHDFF